MKKTPILLALVLAALSCPSFAEASNFDIQRSGPSSFDVVFDYEAPGTPLELEGYQFAFQYKGGSISKINHTPPTGLFDFFGPTYDGSFFTISAGTFSGHATLNSNYTFATITFDNQKAMMDWAVDYPDFNITLSGAREYSNSEGKSRPVQLLTDIDTFQGETELVHNSAVPIPGAVWLLGSGLVGMVAVRRKKA